MNKSPATSIRFMVSFEGLDGMLFTGCDGLEAEYETETYKEGGNSAYTHRLPTLLKFKNLRLSRPVDKDSPAVGKWFLSIQEKRAPVSGIVKLFDANATPVVIYAFRSAFPIKYTGPKLSSAKGEVAIETIELAHTGFEV